MRAFIVAAVATLDDITPTRHVTTARIALFIALSLELRLPLDLCRQSATCDRPAALSHGFSFGKRRKLSHLLT
jgi:hypothetical protein